MAIQDRFGGRFFLIRRFICLRPFPETIDADRNIIYVQPHIGIYFREEKDKDIYQGGEEPYHPHGFMLPDFQQQVK